MWLFSSRKHKVPNSLHHNKRKEREWDFQSIEGGLMKGRLNKIQISESKLNTNDGISVIAEPEVERLSSSPNSCKNGGSIHFDDDAYDPEHPGFHHSDRYGADSAAGHESHKKKGNSHVFPEETEDYIPLFSPDNSDPEEEEFDFSECSEEKQIQFGMFVGNEVCSIPIPQFLLSNEGHNQMKMDHPFASPQGSPCYRLDDSSTAARRLSDASDLQSKDGSADHIKSLPSKGMYSDNHKKRISVFSRLNFSSKGIASTNQNDDASGKELVNDMSRAKKERPCEYEKKEKVTQQKHGIEDFTMCKRTSVFLRLRGASDAVAPQVHCMTQN